MPSIYSTIDDLIDGDIRSPFPPGLRRECRDEQHVVPDRHLRKTAGNALHEAPPPSHSPQRISVIVPGRRLSAGEAIYVNFLDENKKPKTIAAHVPPNSYPGMHFFVEVPSTNQNMPAHYNGPALLI